MALESVEAPVGMYHSHLSPVSRNPSHEVDWNMPETCSIRSGIAMWLPRRRRQRSFTSTGTWSMR